MKAHSKHYLCLIIAMVFSFTKITAQQHLFFSLAYNPAFPINNDLRDYVSKASYNGVQGAVLYHFNSALRAGLQVGFNGLYEKHPRAIYKTAAGADVSAVLSNTIESTPIVAKAEYALINTGAVRPYAGLGAGINLVNFQQYIGEFSSGGSQLFTKPTFLGDVGVLLPFTKSKLYSVRIGTSYNFTPFNEMDIKNIQLWTVQVGVEIPLKYIEDGITQQQVEIIYTAICLSVLYRRASASTA